jgi:DNA-binding NarL/FixJ family response regulator
MIVGLLPHTGDEPQPESVRVLVVDDNPGFRAVLRDVVTATAGMTCVGDAASGEAALEACAALMPHLVIVDKRMPGIGGIEAARRIAARYPDVLVVLVSVEPLRAETFACSGAVAVLDKRELSPQALAELWRTHRP